MSCFPEKKHLLIPSTKASWRSLTSKLQSNLKSLRRSKTIKKATSHLNTFLLRRRPSHHKRNKFRRRKLQQYQHRSTTLAPVYVDELFQLQQPDEPKIGVAVKEAVEKKSPVNDKLTAMSNINGAASSSSMAVGGLGDEVDVRAEMFIAKFRQQIRLQRQRSIEKYQEMLARGL